jgi:hypothetical protein
MAQKDQAYPLRSGRIGTELLSFQFTTDGSGDPSVASDQGATFAHTGTPDGKYTITLPSVYKWLRVVGCVFRNAADGSTKVGWVKSASPGSGATKGTVVLQTQSNLGTDAKGVSFTIDLTVLVKEHGLSP